MKKTWTFNADNIKRKLEEMIKELGEDCEYIEINTEVKKDIERSNCNFIVNNYRIKINDLLHDRAIRATGLTGSITRSIIDCITKG